MSSLNFANFAISSLSAPLAADGTELQTADGAPFPDGSFKAVIWDSAKASPLEDSDSEILTLAKTSGSTFTASRGEEGTAARAWQTGARVSNVLTAETVETMLSSTPSIPVTVSADSYQMERGDTSLFCTFSSGDSYKSITLPEAALCYGLTYSIANKGEGAAQTVRLSPAATETFRDISNSYLAIASGAVVQLAVHAGEWHVQSYAHDMQRAPKTVTAAAPYVCMGDRLVYADASAGSMEISLDENDGVANQPLVIVKADNTANYIYITGGGLAVPVTMKGESVTLVAAPDGTKSVIGRGTPIDSFTTVTQTSALTTAYRHIFAEPGSADIIIMLPHVLLAPYKTITVKKTSSGSGAVSIVSSETMIDGSAYVQLTDQWEHITLVNNGLQWFRVG